MVILTIIRWSLAARRLLLQICRKVCNHGDGLVDLLRHTDEKNLLAVGGNIVEDLGSGPGADQGLESAELQGAVRLLYRNGENIVGPVQIIEFVSVLAPSRHRARTGRDLPLALSATERHHIDFDYSRFTRGVGEPMTVRRKLSLGTARYNHEWFAISLQRQRPNLP